MISNEQAVIAAVVWDFRVLRFATDVCAPSDFEDMRLGVIFRGVARMYAEHEPIDPITVGNKLAAWQVRGISAADLHAWISELPAAQNVAFYAEKVREGALRRGLREISVRLAHQADGADPSTALSTAATALKELRDGHQVVRLAAKPLGEVLEARDDEYDWVIEDLLERGDRMLLTGVEGGGKSTLVRQMAIMSSAGLHPMSFFRTRPARVLVIDAENSEKQWARAVRGMVSKAALHGSLNPADVMALACIPRLDLTRDQDLGMVHRLVDEHRPDILFIGPLYRLIPRAINSDDDAAPLLAALDTLRDRGLAMVIEAHAGHAVGAGGERDLRPRGSAALLGWPEFGLGLALDKKAGASNKFRLVRWRGDRDQRRWPSQLARGISDWPWTPTVTY